MHKLFADNIQQRGYFDYEGRVLMIYGDKDMDAWKSAMEPAPSTLKLQSSDRRLLVVPWTKLRVEDVLKYDYLMVTRTALDRIQERYVTY
jgi:ribosomal protein L4